MSQTNTKDIIDLFVIGGGINGCGIARDAAGRGLSVELAEMNDLASETSSASTKLFHGGLRYLEYWELRLVREALVERETLLKAMPHISWPMRFVLPYHQDMRFESSTPTSKLLNALMPWMKGRRPAWFIRFGLFLYDTLGGRKILPPTRAIDLRSGPEGAPLKDHFTKAYEYSDCWIEDSRLVVLNARDAAERGARINTRTKVTMAKQVDGIWHVTLQDHYSGASRILYARFLVNAGGPWVENIIRNIVGLDTKEGIRLVRGSHIITRKLYDHDKCYFFQGEDGRIIFTIPYETDFTLIGTTDVDHQDLAEKPICGPEEQDYLLQFASTYLKAPVTSEDVVATYSGVRPLYNDAASSATSATRDYVLKLDETVGAPMLNLFGGKITTYRKLAEQALQQISEHIPRMGQAWTAGVALPGGDFPVDGVDDTIHQLTTRFTFLTSDWAKRLVKAYGNEAFDVLGSAKLATDLGEDFGASLMAREVAWLMDKEFAHNAEDVIWRRSKLGLRLTDAQIERLQSWMDSRLNASPTAHAVSHDQGQAAPVVT